MWPFSKQRQLPDDRSAEEAPPHPLALRIYEIEQSIERGFYSYAGGRVAGAFAVVAQMLAEQEDRIKRLDDAAEVAK